VRRILPGKELAMTDRIKREARERQAVTGESYTSARRAVARQAAAVDAVDPALLAPYPDEDGVTAEELGWRVLPADATQQQRARAEAVWRPVRPDRACRCSGSCHHGEACAEEYQEEAGGPVVRCGGRIIHVDRYPASVFELTVWQDDYGCEVCNEGWSASVTLATVPWGELTTTQTASGPQHATTVYDGVRHPVFRGDDEGDDGDWYDGECADCGHDPAECRCGGPDACPECGGELYSPYGCDCPDEVLAG
jgi:hypothetical protein